MASKNVITTIVAVCFLSLLLSMSRAEVTITVGDGSGLPGSSENLVSVSLTNSANEVNGVQMSVCDVGDYISCTGCETTERTSKFQCISHEDLETGCCNIISVSLSGDIIEEGTGPVITIQYDVSEGAPIEECRTLNLNDVKLSDADGVIPSEDVITKPGEFCFKESEITTTTSAETTTTTTTPPYLLSITPLSATLFSGAALQFRVKTSYGEEELEGDYTWEIDPASTIGSTINGNGDNGLFTAGDNNTDSDIEETIKVTDNAHESKTVEAIITIVEKEETGGCIVTISPLAASVYPDDNLILDAITVGNCDTPLYQWSLDSDTNSTIKFDDVQCEYTAGENYYADLLTDVIKVNDTVNESIAEAEITIVGEGIRISPDTVWKCWIPLSYLLVIESGDKLQFNWGTTVGYKPSEAVFSLITLRWDESYIWDFILVMPSWLAGEEDETITVTVTNEAGEVVKGAFEIKLLTL